jgi:hypothetical protein
MEDTPRLVAVDGKLSLHRMLRISLKAQHIFNETRSFLFKEFCEISAALPRNKLQTDI